MLFTFDLLSITYVTLLLMAFGINVKDRATLLTSVPNIIILRAWVGYITPKLLIFHEWRWYWIFLVPIEVVFCYAFEDLYGYCFHRYCHSNKYLFKHVHSFHHKNQAECFTTAFYVHPAELTGFYFIGIVLGPVLLTYFNVGVTWCGLFAWYFSAEFYLFWSHTGRDIPYLPSTKFHENHHRFYNCNYSSIYMDGVMGTLRTDTRPDQD